MTSRSWLSFNTTPPFANSSLRCQRREAHLICSDCPLHARDLQRWPTSGKSGHRLARLSRLDTLASTELEFQATVLSKRQGEKSSLFERRTRSTTLYLVLPVVLL
jgi:hypothetical protein